MKHVFLALALLTVQGQGSPAPDRAPAALFSVEQAADSIAASGSGSGAEDGNPAVSYVRLWRCTASYRMDRRPYYYRAVGITRSGAEASAMSICWANRIPHRLSSPCSIVSCVPEYR